MFAGILIFNNSEHSTFDVVGERVEQTSSVQA